MSNELVVPVKSGVRVLGVDQYEFTVDGVWGKTLAQAVGFSNLRRAVAIEEGARAYSTMLRARQKKVEDLSDLLAILAGTYAKYETDEPKKRSYVNEDYELTDCDRFRELLNKYCISKHDWQDRKDHEYKISAGALDEIRTDVEHLSQKESTSIQEETAILQNYLSKRDSAYSTASKMMAKINTSISSSIQYILG